jgi:hypothetical protein
VRQDFSTTQEDFKGTQAWDNLEFFLAYIKSLYALRKFSNKISLLFLRFSPEFRCSNISAVTEHTRNLIFLERYPKNFFGFSVFWEISKKIFFRFFGFSKFWIFIGEICILIRDFWVIFENYSMVYAEHRRKRFYRMLSIRGTDFIACWAFEERISTHAQPAVKCEYFYIYKPCWAYVEQLSSHAEHTGNRFHRMLSMRGNV